jgi:large subunit ribosomal protein L6
MSRIGKMPIALPKAVEVDITDGVVRVKGPKGELSRPLPSTINIVREDGTLRVERESDAPTQR